MTIDSHQHFWVYSVEEYGWIGDEMKSIRRDLLPQELKQILELNRIDGTVAVEARQSEEETRWLVALAKLHRWIRGVVGWVPLANPKISQILDELSDPALKGVRHVVQAETDPAFLERPDFNRGVREVTRRGLVYDILVYAHQLPSVIQFVDRHPQQRFVLDHAAKPRVGSAVDRQWRDAMNELGRRENVACKISGLASEARPAFSGASQLRPFFDVVVHSFGSRRILYGSDWPVCLAATHYAEWLTAVRTCAAGFSSAEQAAFFGETAAAIYRLT